MLAIDCVPTLTQELVGRCRDPTISELYEERKLLIHRLLKCDATTIVNAHLDMKVGIIYACLFVFPKLCAN